MKLYALFTLHETGWGTRAGIGNSKLTVCPCLRCDANTGVVTEATMAAEKENEAANFARQQRQDFQYPETSARRKA